MADFLLTIQFTSKISKNWSNYFIKYTFELKVKFNQKYYYKKAKCKDIKVINK